MRTSPATGRNRLSFSQVPIERATTYAAEAIVVDSFEQ
jgi:hypothetical protein